MKKKLTVTAGPTKTVYKKVRRVVLPGRYTAQLEVRVVRGALVLVPFNVRPVRGGAK